MRLNHVLLMAVTSLLVGVDATMDADSAQLSTNISPYTPVETRSLTADDKYNNKRFLRGDSTGHEGDNVERRLTNLNMLLKFQQWFEAKVPPIKVLKKLGIRQVSEKTYGTRTWKTYWAYRNYFYQMGGKTSFTIKV